METRPGFKHLYTLQDGESWALFEGKIVVAHPERPPKIINGDGTTSPIMTLIDGQVGK